MKATLNNEGNVSILSGCGPLGGGGGMFVMLVLVDLEISLNIL